MPEYFLDSSALVKRYHQEAGSSWVRAACAPRTRATLHASELARVEVVAALSRTGLREQLHPSFVNSMVNAFERHLDLSAPASRAPVYRLVPVWLSVLQLAAALCARYADAQPHPLRSLDAIQLASAPIVAAVVTDELMFATADTRLGTIASLEGLTVVDLRFAPLP